MPDAPPVATLWRLAWQDEQLSCDVYRQGAELQLRLQSLTAVILTEAFDLQPRAMARAHALRDALKRRGWIES